MKREREREIIRVIKQPANLSTHPYYGRLLKEEGYYIENINLLSYLCSPNNSALEIEFEPEY